MSDNYVLDILLAEDNTYMGTGFSKKQWDTLKDLLERPYYQHRSPAPSSAPLAAPPQTSPPAQPAAAALPADPPADPPAAPPPAPPPAQKPCAPELPPQSTPAPVPAPAPARSFPPSPSVEDIEEVEEKQVYKIPLRNVKKMRQKFGATKKMPRIRFSKFFENCIGLPSKFGAINMCFSRDEDPDAWYTTMLNHKQKIGAIPNQI